MPSSLPRTLAAASVLFLSATCQGHRHTHPRYIHKHEHRASVPVPQIALTTTTLNTSPAGAPEMSTSSSTTLASETPDVQRLQHDLRRLLADFNVLFPNSTVTAGSLPADQSGESGEVGLTTNASKTSSSTLPTVYCEMIGPGSSSVVITCPTSVTASNSSFTVAAPGTIAPSSTATLPSRVSSLSASAPSSSALVVTTASTISVATPSQWTSDAINYTAPYASGGLIDESEATATTVYREQPTAGYSFNASADSNVAVYYGASPATQQDGIIALCENANVDIVNLAFLTEFNVSGYPAINFGHACWEANDAQAAAAGSNLQDCSNVAWEVQGCQAMGKKVLLSIGGATSTGSFASDAEAEQFANTLWSLFGGNPSDNTTTLPLRPFGPQIVLDGFDIDVEDKSTTGWTAFASAMRSLYSTDASKTYYLSAAPQCPIPDASIPQDTVAFCDFVWIQFYNNPSCNVGSSGFLSSFAAWSNLLRNNSNIGIPRLFVGGLAVNSGSGYIDGGDFVNNVTAAKALPNLGNFGGTMLWDGSEGLANIDGTGQNYLEYAKAAARGNGTT